MDSKQQFHTFLSICVPIKLWTYWHRSKKIKHWFLFLIKVTSHPYTSKNLFSKYDSNKSFESQYNSFCFDFHFLRQTRWTLLGMSFSSTDFCLPCLLLNFNMQFHQFNITIESWKGANCTLHYNFHKHSPMLFLIDVVAGWIWCCTMLYWKGNFSFLIGRVKFSFCLHFTLLGRDKIWICCPRVDRMTINLLKIE